MRALWGSRGGGGVEARERERSNGLGLEGLGGIWARTAGGWALEAAGGLGEVGPAQEVGRPNWAGFSPLSLSLFLISLYLPKTVNSKERNKRKKRLEKEFGHGDNFHGLVKMCSVRENRKGQV